MMRIILVLFFVTIVGCRGRQINKVQFTSDHITAVITKMTDIMVHDVTNPPLAARFFSYACLAGYEVIAENSQGYSSMHKKLNEYPAIEKNDSSKVMLIS